MCATFKKLTKGKAVTVSPHPQMVLLQLIQTAGDDDSTLHAELLGEGSVFRDIRGPEEHVLIHIRAVCAGSLSRSCHTGPEVGLLACHIRSLVQY